MSGCWQVSRNKAFAPGRYDYNGCNPDIRSPSNDRDKTDPMQGKIHTYSRAPDERFVNVRYIETSLVSLQAKVSY